MGKVILIIVGLVLGLIGVIMIYDSRIITKKFLVLEIKTKEPLD